MSAESEIDFFISYNRHDRAFAEWIAWILEDAGHQVKIQAWDFRAGENFVLEMDRAATEAKVTIAVLSETYLKSGFVRSEWAAAFAQDPTGEMRKLIPVRVKECDLSGLLSQIVYIDLVGLAEEEAQERLMREISQARLKPDRKPDFPNSQASVPSRSKPVFPPSIPANLPRISDVFVGREVNLEELHKKLQTGRATAIWAIAGMGGIGKTELAAQYAFQHRDLGTYVGGICWLKGREELGTQIVAFARSHLQMTFPENVELSEQVRLCWAQWQPAESLIVFDDVQDYADIEPFLPPQLTHFKILLTTRSRFGSPVQDYEIQVLSEEASLNLLRSLASDGRINQDLEGAKQICEWLGYLPLGLELVGRYLKQKPGTSIAKLWERLQERKLAAKALLKAEPGMTASLGVTAAFELSWQELNLKAQQIAALLSLFAPADIPWSLVESCLPEADEEELEDLRDEQLVNSSLLSFEGEENYRLHQLLREFFAAKRSQMPEDEAMKRAFCCVMTETVNQIVSMSTPDAIVQAMSTIPHFRESATTLNPWVSDDEFIASASQIARFFREQLVFEEAEQWSLCWQATTIQRFGDNHPALSVVLNDLALLYKMQGRYGEAETLSFQALEIMQQHFGKDSIAVVTHINNLAEALRLQGRYREAEQLYLQALKIRKQYFGENNSQDVIVLNNLGLNYIYMRRYAEAEQIFKTVLDLDRRFSAKNDSGIATGIHNLGLVYFNQGRLSEAENLFLEALQLKRTLLLDDHPLTADTLYCLSALYRKQHRYEESEARAIEALEMDRRVLGDSHPNVEKDFGILVGLYAGQERYAEAETLYISVLEGLAENLGETHSKTQSKRRDFYQFLARVKQQKRLHELSDHPMTRSLLQQLQTEES